MQSKNAGRITQIRFKLRRERALVADLDRRITDCQSQRAMLQAVIGHLDEAEHFHLANAIIPEARSLAALDRAEASLAAAVKLRKHAEAIAEDLSSEATSSELERQRV